MAIWLELVFLVLITGKTTNSNNIYILNDRKQCHDCPVEIADVLDKLGCNVHMSYLRSETPLLNMQIENELKSSYAAHFDFVIDPINDLPTNISTMEHFPLLFKIEKEDTLILPYQFIFSGKKGKINKRVVRDFVYK